MEKMRTTCMEILKAGEDGGEELDNEDHGFPEKRKKRKYQEKKRATKERMVSVRSNILRKLFGEVEFKDGRRHGLRGFCDELKIFGEVLVGTDPIGEVVGRAGILHDKKNLYDVGVHQGSIASRSAKVKPSTVPDI